jgi:hypothetical protein
MAQVLKTGFGRRCCVYEEGMFAFSGIPYTQAPIGPLPFTPLHKPGVRGSVHDAGTTPAPMALCRCRWATGSLQSSGRYRPRYTRTDSPSTSGHRPSTMRVGRSWSGYTAAPGSLALAPCCCTTRAASRLSGISRIFVQHRTRLPALYTDALTFLHVQR